MTAQIFGTIFHVLWLTGLITIIEDPILTISLITSASSLLKYLLVVYLGKFNEDVKESVEPLSVIEMLKSAFSITPEFK